MLALRKNVCIEGSDETETNGILTNSPETCISFVWMKVVLGQL